MALSWVQLFCSLRNEILSTILTPLFACPADLLSFAGLVLCIVLTPAFFALFSISSAQRNNSALTVSSDDYFKITQSQNPLGRCLNCKFILNSFAANTFCMDHFASHVPNHEYWCRAHCYCLCFRELSFLIISAVCKETVVSLKLLALPCNPRLVLCGGHFLTLPLDNNGTKIEMDIDQSYAPQLPVSKAFLVVIWLSYL